MNIHDDAYAVAVWVDDMGAARPSWLPSSRGGAIGATCVVNRTTR